MVYNNDHLAERESLHGRLTHEYNELAEMIDATWNHLYRLVYQMGATEVFYTVCKTSNGTVDVTAL